MGMKLLLVNEGNVQLRGEGDTVLISGNIDSQAPSKFLMPFFKDVHNEVISKNIKEIKLDIRKLNFLNSSGIKELVDWILKLDTLPEEQKYVITILTNPELLWQESSISTLVYLNTKLVKKVTA